MKRFIAAGLFAMVVMGVGGTVRAGENSGEILCHQDNLRLTAGCVYLNETNPAEAGAVGRVSRTEYDAHLGWYRGVIEIGDCSPTHVGYCVPVPVAQVYQIHAIAGGTGVHAEGAPAPCVSACAYEANVYVSHQRLHQQQVCYGIEPPSVLC